MSAKQKWAAEYCNYYAGNAIYINGDTTKFGRHKGASGTDYLAVSEFFMKVLEANPKSRFLPDVLGKIPIALAEEGKLDDAEAKLKDAKTQIETYYNAVKAIDPKGYAPIKERADGQIAIAEAIIAEKKGSNADAGAWQEVADKWGSAYNKCERSPELRAQALDGQLRALNSPKLKGSGSESAITLAEEVIERYNASGDRNLLPLLPAAYTGLGNAKFNQARADKDKKQIPSAQKKFAEARWAFVHVVAQFFDVEEYVAEAHFYAGYCYDELKDVEPDAAEKAGRHWNLIKTNFPTSKFKDLAEKKLSELAATDAPPAPAPAPAPEKK
jgi:tetratricopeptide (TPR) repeat protein